MEVNVVPANSDRPYESQLTLGRDYEGHEGREMICEREQTNC